MTGSLAAAFYAVPRATQDVDVVIEAEQSGLDRLVGRLPEVGWYVDRAAAEEAWKGHGQFNAIDPESPESGWKADFIVRKERPFSREEFKRRQRISLLGVELSVASLEDVVIAKLERPHFVRSRPFGTRRRWRASETKKRHTKQTHAYPEGQVVP